LGLRRLNMDRIRVAQKNLEALGAVRVGSGRLGIPRYDRGALKRRVVHLGLGHFHRAHQAVYIDELLNRGGTDSGIFEINLVPDGYALGEIAGAQDYLYTLRARGAGGEEDVRVVGSILGYLNAASFPREALGILSAGETLVISLTVTEKGYCYDTARGDLDWDQGAIIHDLGDPEAPRSTIGFLAAALDRRRRNGGGPVTVMSCDNFPSNGKILERCLLAFCRRVRRDLVPWIEDQTAFPLSMVDRITPGTDGAFLRDLGERYGIEDRWAVGCEDFRQWVLEDRFQEGFPLGGLGELGVQVVKAVEPYELMKIRLLNGSHSALAYPAYLLGYTGVAEAAEDPLLRRFIRERYMAEMEATLPEVPGIRLGEYQDTLIRRFSNRNIADTILRLASEGSKKIPNAMLDPLAELVRARGTGAQGAEARGAGAGGYGGILFALASWARFLTGTGEKGEAIPLEDPMAAELSSAAGRAREDPAGFLRAIGVPGLGEEDMNVLARGFAARLDRIYALGVRGALEELMGK
jgi:mannitol-1-phosphate/altronate dehydrogenase